MVTAEREEAILRADKAEFEMRQLADQRNSLLQQLEAFQNSSPEGFSRTALATDSSAKGLSESAPAKDRSSAGFGPAPESASENSSDLGAQVAELTQQIEAMSARHSALEADLSAAQAKLTEQDSSATQVGFYLSSAGCMSLDKCNSSMRTVTTMLSMSVNQTCASFFVTVRILLLHAQKSSDICKVVVASIGGDHACILFIVQLLLPIPLRVL